MSWDESVLRAATLLASSVCAATASESASKDDASQSCTQIWCAAAWGLSVRAASAVARAKVAVLPVVRNTSKPATNSCGCSSLRVVASTFTAQLSNLCSNAIYRNSKDWAAECCSS